MNINYTGNRRFFKPIRWPIYLGGSLAVLGLPLFFITGGSVVAALPFVVLGAITMFIGHELNVKDSEIEGQIRKEVERVSADLEDHFYDVKKPFPRMLITTVGEYVCEGEEILIRRSSLGKFITSEYHVAAFGFKGSMLYISDERFGITAEKAEQAYHEYDFKDLWRMEYVEVEGLPIKHSRLTLRALDGSVVVSIPSPTDYATQKFVEDTNDIFKRHREEAGIAEPSDAVAEG